MKRRILVGLLFRNAAVLDQNHAYLLRADLVELVDGSHDVAGLPAQTEQGIEAVEQCLRLLTRMVKRLRPGSGRWYR